jgi:putative transposase
LQADHTTVWSAASKRSDMTPLNRPKWNTILDERKGKRMSKSKAHRGADNWGAEGGRNWAIGRGCGSGPGRVQAHDLRLEVEVRMHGRERGEYATEEAGGGSKPGQGHAAIGDSKQLPGLVEKRAEVRRLVDEFRASERRVCGLMEIPRMSYRYRSRRDDSGLRERLLKLAREKPRFGYRRLWVMLTSEERVNHKRVWRVYRDLGLSVKRTRRKRLERALRPRPVLTAPNQEWAVDFVSDVTASGRRLRIFTVVDSYTRECLALEVDTSLPSRRVTRALAKIIDRRGAPVAIRSDNGPEVSSRHYLAWCIEKRIDAVHIQPGKPTQNAHIESFNGRLRDECLNVSWF